jgi:hypothetical protein
MICPQISADFHRLGNHHSLDVQPRKAELRGKGPARRDPAQQLHEVEPCRLLAANAGVAVPNFSLLPSGPFEFAPCPVQGRHKASHNRNRFSHATYINISPQNSRRARRTDTEPKPAEGMLKNSFTTAAQPKCQKLRPCGPLLRHIPERNARGANLTQRSQLFDK